MELSGVLNNFSDKYEVERKSEVIITNKVMPEFTDYVSKIKLSFDKNTRSKTIILIKIDDVIIESCLFTEIGKLYYIVNNFISDVYPYKLYKGLSIEFTGDEIPNEYNITYSIHKLPVIINWIMKMNDTYIELVNSRYKYIHFSDTALVTNSINTVIKYKIMSSIDMDIFTAIQCKNFDKIIDCTEFKYLANCVYPPILGKNKLTLISLYNKDIKNEPFIDLKKVNFNSDRYEREKKI